jgi:hypothetical protein
MRTLVVGAGASIKEMNSSGRVSEFRFPTMANFATEMWRTFQPEPFLSLYLQSIGVNTTSDARQNVAIFCELEKTNVTNVERFFEFCWLNRNAIQDHPAAWSDMTYGCCFMPILDAMISCFHENGKGWIELKAGGSVAKKLRPADLVVNLNYDVVFDLALERSGKAFEYVPIVDNPESVQIAKPHGSINLDVNRLEQTFCFCLPSKIPGSLHSDTQSFSESILPPRLNKNYEQHPISKAIIKPLFDVRPTVLTFWGVGLTESDTDLTTLYQVYSAAAGKVEFINPRRESKDRAETILNRPIEWHDDLDSWLAG